MILDDIVAQKKIEVAQLRARCSLAEWRAQAAASPVPRPFVGALRAATGSIQLIAEVKRQSPSQGVFRADLDAAQLARTYAESGAACISVLTDAKFFAGTLADLRAVHQAVALPILRKDFIIDETQIYEARVAGADAILLIVAMLDDVTLIAFLQLTAQLGMAALIEVHTAAELQRVLPLQPLLVGINNRDLKTFRTDLAVTAQLRPMLPMDCVVVAESGIHTRADVECVQRAGAQAILVGESLVLASDTRAKIRELLGQV